MMSITHAAIAAAGTSLILGTANPLTIGLGILGSQLPDIDTTTSAIGQICYPIAHWIETRYPHRTLTHCLLATGTIALVSLSINHVLGGNWAVGLALPIGHLLACFADCFTKQGVMLFYPYPAWCVSVSNPRRRLKTGGAGELWVLTGAIALLTLGIYFATGGGITHQVSQTLGLKDGQVTTYNEKAAQFQIWADVEGVWASDRRSANGRYWVIAAEGSEFVLADRSGIYKTGQQIITTKLVTNSGDRATTQTQSLTFNDEEVLPRLQAIGQQFPSAAVYLSGELAIDMPESIQPTASAHQLQTLALTGSTVKLNYHPLERALLLRDQYGTGTLEVKIISPKPIL